MMRHHLLLSAVLLVSPALRAAEPEAARAADISPEELFRKMNEFSERADKDSKLYMTKELDDLLEQQGPAYKKLLVAQFRNADHITVSEVSSPFDFDPPEGSDFKDLPEYEYTKVRLTDAQRKMGLEALEAMNSSTMRPIPRCSFSPNHRVDIVNKDGSVSKMWVCFACMISQWTGQPGFTQPRALSGTMGVIVEAAGLQKTRPWKKMAQERRKQEAEKAATGGSPDKSPPAK